MSYSNSPVPEGMNISQHRNSKYNTLRQLLLLGGIVLGFLVVTLILVMKLAAWGASTIPFEYEKMLAESMNITSFVVNDDGIDDKAGFLEAQTYLQDIANRVAEAQKLPEEMQITVHLVLDDTVNAFATLGGHLFLHQGLLEKLSSENALTMLVGHEVAHIYSRDPIRAAGGILLTGVFVEWLTGGSGFGAAIIGEQAAQLVASGFSREQEAEADEFATQALDLIYGHTAGGEELFEVLLKESASDSQISGFWSSHPATQDRLLAMPRSVGDTTALAVDFSEL